MDRNFLAILPVFVLFRKSGIEKCFIQKRFLLWSVFSQGG